MTTLDALLTQLKVIEAADIKQTTAIRLHGEERNGGKDTTVLRCLEQRIHDTADNFRKAHITYRAMKRDYLNGVN